MAYIFPPPIMICVSYTRYCKIKHNIADMTHQSPALYACEQVLQSSNQCPISQVMRWQAKGKCYAQSLSISPTSSPQNHCSCKNPKRIDCLQAFTIVTRKHLLSRGSCKVSAGTKAERSSTSFYACSHLSAQNITLLLGRK